jgi:hypothetical protein
MFLLCKELLQGHLEAEGFEHRAQRRVGHGKLEGLRQFGVRGEAVRGDALRAAPGLDGDVWMRFDVAIPVGASPPAAENILAPLEFVELDGRARKMSGYIPAQQQKRGSSATRRGREYW